MDALASRDERHDAYGEIARSWSPTLGSSLRVIRSQATVGNKPGAPRRTRISRKAIAQGVPVFRRTCGVSFACGAAGATDASGAPCAL